MMKRELIKAPRWFRAFYNGLLDEEDYQMATKKKAAKKAVRKSGKERNIVDRESITMEDNLEIPPSLKKSKYPWAELAAEKPKSKSFLVPCDSEEEARSMRTSVYASGKNYLEARKIPLSPIVRTIEKDEEWFVAAWVAEIEE